MNQIEGISVREVLDSRGNPTVEADVALSASKCVGRAIVPSGASTGSREALELRDKDPKRYLGKGVLKALANVREKISPALIGKKFESQKEFDQLLIELDGTENKSNLGANAILAVSMAFSRAVSKMKEKYLFEHLYQEYSTFFHPPKDLKAYIMPVPLMNILNGGAHADNGLDIQEFMIVPDASKPFHERLKMGVEVFHHLKSILQLEHLRTTVGDEGGFAPTLEDYENPHEQVLEFLMQAIEQAGYKPGKDISLALDVAASEFYKEGAYQFQGRALSATKMIEFYKEWVDEYPIISIEDGLAEGDWEGWKNLTQTLGSKCQLVGDDLFVTNPKILKEGIQQKIANSILIKLNQIGTVSETLEAISMAQNAGYKAIISHRSGESEDTFIADLAVATSAGQIKTGSASRSDRLAKYNQLLRIEEALLAK